MEVWKFQIREGKGKFRPVRLDFLKKGDFSQSEVEIKVKNKEFFKEQRENRPPADRKPTQCACA